MYISSGHPVSRSIHITLSTFIIIIILKRIWPVHDNKCILHICNMLILNILMTLSLTILMSGDWTPTYSLYALR